MKLAPAALALLLLCGSAMARPQTHPPQPYRGDQVDAPPGAEPIDEADLEWLQAERSYLERSHDNRRSTRSHR